MCVHTHVHVCVFVLCLHLCIQIHMCVEARGWHCVPPDHSPPMTKVRGRVSHLNPDLIDTPSLARQLNPGGHVSASCSLGLQWIILPDCHLHVCWISGIAVGHHALLAFTRVLEVLGYSGPPWLTGIYWVLEIWTLVLDLCDKCFSHWAICLALKLISTL